MSGCSSRPERRPPARRYTVTDVAELLAYDEDKAFTLMDDAATVNRIVRTAGADGLRAARFGDWAGMDVLAHLTDVAEVFAERVRRAIDEDTPTLPAIPEGSQADAPWDAMDLARRFLGAHQRIVALMQRPGAAARPAVHSALGPVTAGFIAAYEADHSRSHVNELAGAFPPAA